ncbi:MAG: hypothetical protein IPG50_35930 [Myxococcales bacterium]|nr:hypothetical protein [Myxococcales bacterium]
MRLLLRAFLIGTLALASCEDDPATVPSVDVPTDGGADGDVLPVDAATAPDAADAIAVDPFADRSGTRVALRNFNSADGFRYRAGFFDRQTGEPCNVRQLAQDGVRRCLPSAAAVFFYADAACTQRVASYTSCAAKPEYAAENVPDADACTAPKTRVYKLGAELGGPAPDGGAPAIPLYVKDGPSCTASPASPNTTYVSVASEVPPAEFVAFKETRVPAGAALNAVYYDGDDGSRIFATFEDKARASPCTFWPMSDGTFRCTPASPYVSGFFGRFADGVCTSELTFASCPASAKVARRFVPSCPNVMQFYDIGAAHPADGGVFFKAGASCVATAPTAGFALFALGAELQPAAFSQGTLGPFAPTGRLAARKVVVDKAEVPVAVETFERRVDVRDTLKDAICSPQLASDGVYRCLPDGALAAYYSDATCTERVGFTYLSSCGGAPTYAKYTGPECLGRGVVASVKGKRAGTSVYAKSASGCTLTDLGAEVELWDVGAVVAPTEFAEMTLTIE